VKQDDAYSVKVETDDNLQQYIVIDQSGGTLHIRQQHNVNLRSTGPIKVYVSAPQFTYLNVSGASRIVGQNTLSNSSGLDIGLSGASTGQLELKIPKVKADISGASGITLVGETKDLSIQASGASEAKCFGLLSENTDVDASGASHAEVHGSVKINASASGASDVYYKGSGALTKDESGASSVRKVE
jgi:Putative auto-transporter adhesin, head GIN domain